MLHPHLHGDEGKVWGMLHPHIHRGRHRDEVTQVPETPPEFFPCFHEIAPLSPSLAVLNSLFSLPPSQKKKTFPSHRSAEQSQRKNQPPPHVTRSHFFYDLPKSASFQTQTRKGLKLNFLLPFMAISSFFSKEEPLFSAFYRRFDTIEHSQE